jgi:hypothetical protein
MLMLNQAKTLSLETMARKESEKEMCIFKQASAIPSYECYECDGFNYNCESYKIQLIAEKISKSKFFEYD